ncbi:MAG: alkaline phosphatase [Candidatus Thorarchaeota archaeon]
MTRLLQVTLLMLIFISPGLLLDGNSITTHDFEEQSVIADTGPLSIILMIGDGMGYEHVELARLAEVGVNGSLYMQDSMWNASMTTLNANGDVTDSAAAGTALATGNKTINGMLGMLPDQTHLENIIEFAQTLGKATGLVSTCRIVDATPASFSTHVVSRYDQDIIAQQLIQDAGVDVLLGGGTDYFSSANINTMESNGYSVVYDRTAMNAVTTGKIFGLFSEIHMDYEYDRNPMTEPSISEMTNKSIELLSQDPDGFFLMVEGGKIDLAAHAENKVNNAQDTIAFDKAVKIALDYVGEHNNTILIVTADHETEGLVVLSHDLNATLPASLATEAEKKDLRVARINNVTVDWTAGYHTDWPVPVFCYGSVFSELTNDITIDNTEIFGMMKDYYRGIPLNVTEAPVTTTTTTTTTTTDTTSTTDPTNTSTTSGTGGLTEQQLDPMTLVIAGVGAAVIVVVILIIIKKR